MAAKPRIKLEWRDGKLAPAARDQMGSSGARFGATGIMAGILPNLVNSKTGLGLGTDHNAQLAFRDIYLGPTELDVVYRNSWVIQKMVDIPVDDMFTPGRTWTGDDEGAIKAMETAEAALRADKAKKSVMKCGTLYGTGLLVVLSADKDPAEELVVDQVTEGSISNLLVLDRWRADIDSWVLDPRMPRYGKPHMYRISPLIHSNEGQFYAHHSRVIRCDGLEALQTEGWSSYERDWGVSRVNSAINEVAREEAMQVGVDHLVQEASVQVMKISGFKEALMSESGRLARDEPTIQELALANSMNKSLFRTIFADSEDETDRIAVNFSGLPDLIERKAVRLASMFDVPVTRFLGVSPGGLNATGDSDTLNYSINLETRRNAWMARDGRRLDQIVARHAGLAEPPDSEWMPIFQVSPEKRAAMFAAQSTAVKEQAEAGNIDENEAREALSRIPEWFGELSPWSDDDIEQMREAINPQPEPPAEGPPAAEE